MKQRGEKLEWESRKGTGNNETKRRTRGAMMNNKTKVKMNDGSEGIHSLQ